MSNFRFMLIYSEIVGVFLVAIAHFTHFLCILRVFFQVEPNFTRHTCWIIFSSVIPFVVNPTKRAKNNNNPLVLIKLTIAE